MEATQYSDAETTLRKGGKTFAWARRFLGAGPGHEAARLYAFCRLLDDLADGDIADGPARLHRIRNELASGQASDPDLVRFKPLMEQRGIPATALNELIEGLLGDQDDVLIASEAELHRYCYRVAGTVGLMMCPILGIRQDETLARAQAHAVDLGIAMQMTNIARDILEDAAMGRRYLPADWVGGISPQDIRDAARNGDARVDARGDSRNGDSMIITRVASAAERLVEEAERYYDSGIRGLNYLPAGAHLAILIAARAYRQIGRQLVRRGCRWHEGRQVTTKATKLRVSLPAFPLMLARLAPVGDHDQALHHGLRGLPHVHQ